MNIVIAFSGGILVFYGIKDNYIVATICGILIFLYSMGLFK